MADRKPARGDGWQNVAGNDSQREKHKGFIYWPFICQRKVSCWDKWKLGFKENEISAAAEVLAEVPLKNRVVCADALQTQRQLSVEILAKGGDYLWTAKDNQPTLRADIEQFFKPPVLPKDGTFPNCLVGKRKRLIRDMDALKCGTSLRCRMWMAFLIGRV